MRTQIWGWFASLDLLNGFAIPGQNQEKTNLHVMLEFGTWCSGNWFLSTLLFFSFFNPFVLKCSDVIQGNKQSEKIICRRLRTPWYHWMVTWFTPDVAVSWISICAALHCESIFHDHHRGWPAVCLAVWPAWWFSTKERQISRACCAYWAHEMMSCGRSSLIISILDCDECQETFSILKTAPAPTEPSLHIITHRNFITCILLVCEWSKVHSFITFSPLHSRTISYTHPKKKKKYLFFFVLF